MHKFIGIDCQFNLKFDNKKGEKCKLERVTKVIGKYMILELELNLTSDV